MAQETKKRVRSCIGCGSKESKGSLRRIVRASDGSVSYDPSGRVAGRGAYVCSSACFTAACKAHKLDRALRVKLSEQDYERVAAELACACDLEDMRTGE